MSLFLFLFDTDHFQDDKLPPKCVKHADTDSVPPLLQLKSTVYVMSIFFGGNVEILRNEKNKYALSDLNFD